MIVFGLKDFAAEVGAGVLQLLLIGHLTVVIPTGNESCPAKSDAYRLMVPVGPPHPPLIIRSRIPEIHQSRLLSNDNSIR